MPLARVLLLSLVALLGAVAPAVAAMPANTGAPSISGAARKGQTLTRDAGTWTGTGTLTYTQRWQRCDATGAECVNLPATGATYTLIAPDVGAAMRVVVTATNPDGVASATSAATVPVSGTLSADDVGQRIAVKVTATNAAGKASAESAPTAAVAGVR